VNVLLQLFKGTAHATLMQIDADYRLEQNSAVSTAEFSDVYRAEIDELRKFWSEKVEPKKQFVRFS